MDDNKNIKNSEIGLAEIWVLFLSPFLPSFLPSFHPSIHPSIHPSFDFTYLFLEKGEERERGIFIHLYLKDFFKLTFVCFLSFMLTYIPQISGDSGCLLELKGYLRAQAWGGFGCG